MSVGPRVHPARRASVSIALLMLTSLLVACASGGPGDVPASGSDVLLPGRDLTAVIEGITTTQEDDDLWNVDVTAVHYSRDVVYRPNGEGVPLAKVEVGMSVPMYVDVPLKRGESYLFLATHVGVGSPDTVLTAHGIVTSGDHEPVQAFLPTLEELLYPGEENTEANRIRALVELEREAEARQAAGADMGNEGPRHEQAVAVLTELGYFTHSTRAPDYDDNVGMAVSEYLDLAALDRQVLEFHEMPARAIEELGLVRVPALVDVPDDLVRSVWAVGIRSDVGTTGPYSVVADSRFVSLTLAIPVSGSIEVVVWPTQPERGGVPFGRFAQSLDPTGVTFSPEEIGLTDGRTAVSGETLLIDVASGEVEWIPSVDAIAMVTAWMAENQ